MSFFDWLAGFTDGEGNFSIKLHKGYNRTATTYSCCFFISLREDDAEIIFEIQQQLGFGNINYRAIQTWESSGRNNNPQITFSVTKLEDCLKLVAIFEEHPLRAKKKFAFQVWAKTVRHLCGTKSLNQYDVISSGRDFVLLAQLKDEIQMTNSYKAVTA